MRTHCSCPHAPRAQRVAPPRWRSSPPGSSRPSRRPLRSREPGDGVLMGRISETAVPLRAAAASLRAPLWAIARIAETRGPSPFAGRPLYHAPRGPAQAQARLWRVDRPDRRRADGPARRGAHRAVARRLDGRRRRRGRPARRRRPRQGGDPRPGGLQHPEPGLRPALGRRRRPAGGLPRLDRRPGRRPRRRPGGGRAGARRARRARRLPASARGDRTSLLAWATARLSRRPGVSVYIDAGNASWVAPAAMARRLREAGVARARGFAVNVAGFHTTERSRAYGRAISRRIGGAPFVIDTSRNGAGPAPGDDWCNPPGRALGQAPTAQTGRPGGRRPAVDQAARRVGRQLQRRPARRRLVARGRAGPRPSGGRVAAMRPPRKAGPRARVAPLALAAAGALVLGGTPALLGTVGAGDDPAELAQFEAGAHAYHADETLAGERRNEAVLDRCESRRRLPRGQLGVVPRVGRSPARLGLRRAAVARRRRRDGRRRVERPQEPCPRWRSTRWCCPRARCCGSAGRPTTTAAPRTSTTRSGRASTPVPPPLVEHGNGQTLPANIWCGGQAQLPDGRVLVAGGNLAYPAGDKDPGTGTATRAPPGSTSSTPSPRPGSASRSPTGSPGTWSTAAGTRPSRRSRTGAC